MSIERRLQRLESDAPGRKTGLFVIEGNTAAERNACIAKLIDSGRAKGTDSFIHTGVTRCAGFTDCGTVDGMLVQVAAAGIAIHDGWH
jgi:hypothetical protein